KGSLTVGEGDIVHLGQPLAKCGNSGNTSHPHLHIQVQDAPRIFVTGKRDARTYPILFRDATRLRAGQAADGAPFLVRRNDRIIREAVAANTYYPQFRTLIEQPPVVVETIPVSGAQDIPAGESEIRVRFNKQMMDRTWSWSSAWENAAPQL